MFNLSYTNILYPYGQTFEVVKVTTTAVTNTINGILKRVVVGLGKDFDLPISAILITIVSTVYFMGMHPKQSKQTPLYQWGRTRILSGRSNCPNFCQIKEG